MYEHADLIESAHRIIDRTEAQVAACYTHPLMTGRRAEQARKERETAAAAAHNIRANAGPWFIQLNRDGSGDYQPIAAAALDGCSGASPAFGASELPGGASWHRGRAADAARRARHFDRAADAIIAAMPRPDRVMAAQFGDALAAYLAERSARYQALAAAAQREQQARNARTVESF